MKKFTKLALVSSLAISANAMAMQAMDDASLGATTGQDGINIGIGISKIEIEKLFIHDNDGLAAGSAVTYVPLNATTSPVTVGAPVSKAIVGGTAQGNAGAIVIDGLTIKGNYKSLLSTQNLMDLRIDSSGSTDGAYINIAAAVSGLEINVGAIGVGASGIATDTGRRGVVANSVKQILTPFTITTGQMAANIQLGSTPQGAMIKLNSTMQGGLTISDLGIIDSAGGGQITLGKISVNDANAADLTIDADISVTNTGLKITSREAAAGTDIYVQGINLGAAPTAALGIRGTARTGSIGDMEVQGLKTWSDAGYTTRGSIITVSGR
ncbi:hypothetical protein AY606_12690 [Acinetobacter sp. SFB]|uniref:putative pilus system protein FilA n=1 Tax=Acinetobacter sp. SFB TaxID=1805634 RepID=UPI0007D81DAC|nr:DUF6160 family protein [Acinetobacter sp. SFB]OAL76173.1 hypothetical protein AY606_12690 [Acinetobacter sp. SFB]